MRKRLLTLAFACLGLAAMIPGAAHAQTTPAADASATDAPADDFKPSGKLWGYAFGDYAYKVHADSAGKKTTGTQYGGQPKDWSAFDFRRIYLGYDYNIAKGFSTQLLLAHESDGTVTADNKRAFYLKLANVRWTFAKNTDLVVGSQETPGFAMLEERIWGYRSIEKTITDWRGIITSTDLGASIQGKLNDKGDYGYNALFSNGTVATPSTPAVASNIYKKMSADMYGKFLDQKIVVDVYGDYLLSQRLPYEKNKATGKIFVAYTTDLITVGFTIFEQVAANGVTYKTVTGKDTSKAVNKNSVVFGYSGFVRGQIIPGKLNYFARYDNFNPDNLYATGRVYTTETSYYTPVNGKISVPVRENFITAGFDWTPTKNVHFMPNIWIDTYMNPAANAEGKNKSDMDVEARMTFYYIFGRDNANIPGKLL